MMVPRSYAQAYKPSGSPPGSKETKRSIGTTTTTTTLPRPRFTPPEPTIKRKDSVSEPEKQRSAPRIIPSPPERTVSEPVSIPTAPMLVQPRYHPTARSPSPHGHTQTLKSRGQNGGRLAGRKLSEKHDPGALPPAVAALLAVTAIPPPTSLQRRRKPSQQRRISIDELIQEWRQEGTPTSGSPLDVLLEPTEEADEEDDALFQDTEDEKDPAILSSRSVSSDSIDSMPSLDAARSTMSNFSLTTPSFRSKRNLSLRTDKLASPPTEECLDDHPLRSPSPASLELPSMQTFPTRPKRVVKQKSTFKSNLTASISALKSAAKSFSNFTAPSIPQDDMLTRSFFSTPYPPEMRPKEIDGVPGPALRRYLNPTTHTVPQHLPSPVLSLQDEDFSYALQEALAQSPLDPSEPETPLIQMQTYSRRRKHSNKSRQQQPSVGPDRGEAALLKQSLDYAKLRQREPRENSDFLRVIVLEMNMRRTGKLDSKGQFRARIWLPPRKEGDHGEGVEVREGKEVPLRWVGVSPEDL